MGKRYQDEYDKERDKLNRKLNDTNKKKKKKKKKRSILKTIIVTIFILGILGCFAFAGMVFGVINGSEKLEKSDLKYNNLTTFVYDKYGNEYATSFNPLETLKKKSLLYKLFDLCIR